MNREKYIVAGITSKEICRIRKNFNLTQQEFADILGCSKKTLERYESGNVMIPGTVALLCEIILNDSDVITKRRIPRKEYPLRLYYMYFQHVCTIIDVDIVSQKVRIYNYTNNLLRRAFGKNEEPSFKDYEKFLESRCFPASRDKIKLELERLELPFYDSLMIIEKTEGRMAEDDFWIKIER